MRACTSGRREKFPPEAREPMLETRQSGEGNDQDLSLGRHQRLNHAGPVQLHQVIGAVESGQAPDEDQHQRFRMSPEAHRSAADGGKREIGSGFSNSTQPQIGHVLHPLSAGTSPAADRSAGSVLSDRCGRDIRAPQLPVIIRLQLRLYYHRENIIRPGLPGRAADRFCGDGHGAAALGSRLPQGRRRCSGQRGRGGCEAGPALRIHRRSRPR